MNNLSVVVVVCLVYPPVGVLYEPFIGPTRLSSHSQLVDFITLGFLISQCRLIFVSLDRYSVISGSYS